MKPEYLLQLKEISKNFSGVYALKNVSLNVRYGEIHALIGENGAGKSTLLKILTGIYFRDKGGKMLLDGKEINPTDNLSASVWESAPCIRSLISALCSAWRKTCSWGMKFASLPE